MNQEWKEREAGRLESGVYQKLPPEWWGVSPNFTEYLMETFAHVSGEDQTKIAYTKDDRSGIDDRQERSRPGKFIMKFFDREGDEVNQSLLVKLATSITRDSVQVSFTKDGIESVAVMNTPSCPRSCMNDKHQHLPACNCEECGGGPDNAPLTKDHLSSPLHPYIVYDREGGSDLSVAYIGEIGKKIRERVIVNEGTKEYGRIYGGESGQSILEEKLVSLGYSMRGKGWDGCRIIRRAYGNDKVIIPYMDGVDALKEVEGSNLFLIVDNCHGNLSYGVDGYSYLHPDRFPCIACGSTYHENDMVWWNDVRYCQECHGENFGYCSSCDDCHPHDDLTYYEVRGDHLCQGCHEEEVSNTRSAIRDGMVDAIISFLDLTGRINDEFWENNNVEDMVDDYLEDIDWGDEMHIIGNATHFPPLHRNVRWDMPKRAMIGILLKSITGGGIRNHCPMIKITPIISIHPPGWIGHLSKMIDHYQQTRHLSMIWI